MPKSETAKSQSKTGNTPAKGKLEKSGVEKSEKASNASILKKASAPKASAPKASAPKASAPKASTPKASTPKAPAKKVLNSEAPSKKALEEKAPAGRPSQKKNSTSSSPAPASDFPEASKKKSVPAPRQVKADSSEEKTKAPAKPTNLPDAPPAPRVHGPKVKLSELKDPFLILQRDRIFQLRDSILESMQGVAKDTLRSRAEGSEASAFGMHQADAGSDAYDRDFALSLLSQEQDALYEIEEALKRMELGQYGVCEMSGKKISHARLEALPFARYTVECQAEVERQKKLQKARMPVTSLFGLTEEEGAEAEEEDQISESKE
jgi:DnaK suppressor protein